MVDSVKKWSAQIEGKDLVKFFIFLAIAVVLVVLAFRGISLQWIIMQIGKAKFQWVFLSFLMSVLALISRAYRWNILIEPLHYNPPLRKTVYAVSIGYFANLALPRLGEITRCGSLNKSEAIPFNILLGTVITERIIDVISLILCLAITTIIEFERLGHFIKTSIVKPIAEKTEFLREPPILIASSIVLITISVFVLRYVRASQRSSRQNKLALLLKGMLAGMDSIRKLKRPWAFIFHSILIWLLYYLSVYLALFALPATEDLGLSAALFLLVAGGIAMSAPVQGGIGAYHLLVSQGLVFYGVSQMDGLAFATLLHSLQIIIILIFGSISLLLLFLERNRGNKTEGIFKQ